MRLKRGAADVQRLYVANQLEQCEAAEHARIRLGQLEAERQIEEEYGWNRSKAGQEDWHGAYQ